MNGSGNFSIVYRPIAALISFARNSRTHSEPQVALIAGSIREYGFTNLVLVDGENGIIARHGRVMASRKLPLAQVPLIVLSQLKEAQKRAYTLAENKLAEQAGWDKALLALELGDLQDMAVDLGILGFEAGELDALLRSGEVDPSEEDIPEAPVVPISRPGDLWRLGNHRLICGDATDEGTVARVRVSPPRHGASGLGLEAQRKVIDDFDDFAASRGAKVLARFTVVESGCKVPGQKWPRATPGEVTGATVVIAKLDRLRRNAVFFFYLRDSRVRFVAVDMPEPNHLTVGTIALVDWAEREATSRRIEEALSVAKACGVKLDNTNGAESLRRSGEGRAGFRAAVSANAAAFPADLVPVLPDIRAAGHTSLRALAVGLTSRGIRTRRGVSGVANTKRIMLRILTSSFQP